MTMIFLSVASLEFKRHLRSHRVTHYVILSVIMYAFHEMKVISFSSFHEVIGYY